MKFKKIALGSALLLGAALSSVSAQAADKVRFVTEGAWAPFNFIDSAGKPQGFDVDIARALCAKMAADCEILTQDWDGLIPGLKVRKFDAIIASMSITEDRLKVVDFTNKYYSGGLRFMGRVGETFDLANLSGKTIGAQRATLGAQYLEDNFEGKADLKFYDNQDNVYLDLVSGRLDIVLSDELPTYNWLKTSESGSAFEFKGDAFMKTDNIAIAVRKSDTQLKEKINKALDAILADGTYQKINAKYFPFSIY
ncbi:MAG: transporter substrate-binding domain-containing protein [Marinomonas foliarum]|jgi:putative lysine/arginine/ornithine/histidine/octopine transport system substrate-binding protein|uniref:Amino acid ABC transporter substrate-binding protein (PAAT family) n=1 Tax=Marinomonas foliarum TaxID=491950 RepID=A0A369AFQ1_9GAMM|nr:transporter substrate-binding domain-containing protein [Marinomonas foliarum]QRV24960.1 transporter substrate-binding domain-containing protein [Marinomonas foliarum]RCX07945.1 amino acid ABC transporter substrate-binding protein (PAAT family) [Marinomonas foliarum]